MFGGNRLYWIDNKDITITASAVFFIPKTSINLSRSPHPTTFDNFILNLITFIIDIINNLSYHYHIKTNQLNNKVKQDYELFN